MKILFLDFDGVLNSKQHFLATKDIKIKGVENPDAADLLRMKTDVNANNMWVLGYILKKIPDLQIVISSAWRLHYDIEQFKELFRMFKLDDTRIIGKTGKKFSSERCHEIWMYLDDLAGAGPHDCPVDISDGPCGECENATMKIALVQWLALDDHQIFNLDDKDFSNQHLTDSWVGLTMPDAFKIIRHFNPNYEEPVMFV